MSICPEPDICSLYVDGELSGDKKVDFELHVKVCSKCKSAVNSYKRLKGCITCGEVPMIDLEQSFKKLIFKQSLKNSFLLYRLFYQWKQSKIFFRSSMITFLFAVMLVSVISLRNRMEMIDSDASFKPIIPIAYESHLPTNLKDINFSSMSTSFRSERKMNTRTYKNMVNTFNSFSNLYSNLEHNENCVYGNNVSIMNKTRLANYCSDMPFYRTLNKK